MPSSKCHAVRNLIKKNFWCISLQNECTMLTFMTPGDNFQWETCCCQLDIWAKFTEILYRLYWDIAFTRMGLTYGQTSQRHNATGHRCQQRAGIKTLPCNSTWQLLKALCTWTGWSVLPSAEQPKSRPLLSFNMLFIELMKYVHKLQGNTSNNVNCISLVP